MLQLAARQNKRVIGILISFSILSLLILGMIGFGGKAEAAQGLVPGEDYQPGVILVEFASGNISQSPNSIMQDNDAVYLRSMTYRPVHLWQVEEGRELEIIENLKANPDVQHAQLNYVYRAMGTVPNDPRYPDQWALAKINAPQAWSSTTGSSGVVIAVVDTGIDPTHEDLVGKIILQTSTIAEEPWNQKDGNGHGTHVSGIAGAISNNAKGIAGVSWGARIMPIRALDDSGNGYTSDIAEGIDYARMNGAEIINLSLGGKSNDPTMETAVNNAHNAGIVVVAAMGNSDTSIPYYPAAYTNVVAVAATDQGDDRAYYSNYGSHVDVAAPGGEVTSTNPMMGILSTLPEYTDFELHNGLNGWYLSTEYDALHGTSQAAPHVAGLAALVLSINPGLTPDEVEHVIENSAKDLGAAGFDDYFGHGRIDAAAAVAAVPLSDDPPTAPNVLPINNGDGNGDYLVDWSSEIGTEEYSLQVADNFTFSGATTIYSGMDTQYAVTAQTGGTWYYRVRASNSNGNSDWSNVVHTTVKPGAPTLTLTQAAPGDDNYMLDWDMPDGTVSFIVEEDDSNTFNHPTVIYEGNYSAFNVTGQPGGTWWYRVKAVNAGGESSWSNLEDVEVDPHPIEPPVLQPIENGDGDGDYSIQWTDTITITTPEYALEVSKDIYFADPQVVYTGTMTETLITDQPGGTWYYRVRVSGDEESSAWSNIESVLVTSYLYLPLISDNYPGDFDSQFRNSTDGWEVHSGTWTITDEYYKTGGIPGKSASISFDRIYSNFDYSVRVYRSGCELCANRIWVRGTPEPLNDLNNWGSGIIFQYNMTGAFSIWQIGNGVPLQDWVESSAINPGRSWNTLRVVGEGVKLYFYINNAMVWSGSVPLPDEGRVGIGMYRSAISKDDLLKVDWAKLTVDVSASTATISQEQEALNTAANQTFPGNIDFAP